MDYSTGRFCTDLGLKHTATNTAYELAYRPLLHRFGIETFPNEVGFCKDVLPLLHRFGIETREILFGRGSKWKVTDLQKRASAWYVTIEQQIP